MVHIHALIYGEYIPQRVLQDAWSRVMGQLARVDVRSVVGPGGVASAIREVLKYATKGEKGQRAQPRHAAAVELAFRDVHRVAIGGALRKIRIADSDGETEDIQRTDLHDDDALTCESCGSVGEWEFVAIVPSAVVVELGGFGILDPSFHQLQPSG